MDNIKVNLSILLPGGTMLSVEESTRIIEEPVKTPSGKNKQLNGEVVTTPIRVMDTHKHDKFEMEIMDRGRKETIKVFTRKSKKARQVMHLTEDAFDYMTSDERPYDYKGIWSRLTDMEKLKWHCNRIAETIGGTVESIQILD